MKTWVLSWKVRPNCAVLMARRRGLLVEEPMSTLGFCVTGEMTPVCLRGRGEQGYSKGVGGVGGVTCVKVLGGV